MQWKRSIGFGMTCVSVKPEKLSLGLLPVIWLPSWISSTYRRPTKPEVPPLASMTPKTGCSRWNCVATCSRTRDMPGGILTPSPSGAGKRRKKPLPGEGLKHLVYGKHVLPWRLQPTSSTRNPTEQTRTNCETTESRTGNRTPSLLLTCDTFTIVLG